MNTDQQSSSRGNYAKIENAKNTIQPGKDLMTIALQHAENKDYRSCKKIYHGLVEILKQDLEDIIYEHLENGWAVNYRVAHDYEWLINSLNDDNSIDKTDSNRYKFFCLYREYHEKRRMTWIEQERIKHRKPIKYVLPE